MDKWPSNWGILFATYASKNNIIYGKVRLNKFLSLLQREGFPIKNKFVAHKMGPYDKKIDHQAEVLEKKGLIKINEKETTHESDLFIYEITEEGKDNVKKNIIPLLNKLEDPFAFKRSFIKLREFVTYNKMETVIDDVHKNLYLDDKKEFITELLDIKKEIEKNFKNLEKENIDFCHNYLDYLAYFEFTNDSLDIIIDKYLNDKFVGKNHVLYNSKKLIERYNTIYKNFRKNTFKKCRKYDKCLSYPCPDFDESLSHRFRCIELNSDVYDINESIDLVNTDFREYWRERTPSSNPN